MSHHAYDRSYSFGPDDGHQPPLPPIHGRGLPPTAAHHDPSNPVAAYSNAQDPAAAYTQSYRTASPTTPGVDNLGVEAAGGGITGIAYVVASTNERESGLQALRDMQRAPGAGDVAYHHPPGEDGAYLPPDPAYLQQPQDPGDPFGSQASLAPPSHLSHNPDDGMALEDYPPDPHGHIHPAYLDSSYQRHVSPWDANVDGFNPDDIEDDGDDGIAEPPQRRSVLSLGRKSSASLPGAPVAGGAAAGGILGGALGHLGNRDAGGSYGPVQSTEYRGPGAEKSEWLDSETKGRTKVKWFLLGTGVLFVALVIAGAVVGGVLASRKNGAASPAGGTGLSASQDDSSLLDANSAEIKALMNNPGLHKVFPGMAYTPYNAQYPACLAYPPSQNNVTRDMAVISQLTNTIRLYGTDCNQTDLVLGAIDRLGLGNMKVWLAVWLDGNQTTNDRGVGAMYDILDRHGAKPFSGVIIGNEVLYRKEMSAAQIETLIGSVRANLTAKGVDLPVAVADLGDKWTADLARYVDVVMSNVHPFFAGKSPDEAAAWAWSFWTEHDTRLTADNATKQNIISEIGWPSEGGKECGDSSTCTDSTPGSVAGIDEINTFMANFVCQSLTNKTDYFWFEAFDEPWKVRFNGPGKNWEDKWGLMDTSRKLKKGLKVPDCGSLNLK